MIELTIDGRAYTVEKGRTIMEAAYRNGVYIPAVCHHPDLPPFNDLTPVERVYRGDNAIECEPIAAGAASELEGCGLCVVAVEGTGEPVRACCTTVEVGMSISTTGAGLEEIRRRRLAAILANHPHACITCAQREGCSLEDCSSNTAVEDRCCAQFHNCELRKVAEYVGVPEDTPRFEHPQLPVLEGEPLFNRNFNLCIDCTRCVRVCNEVRGVGALGVAYRDGRAVVGSVAPTLAESDCRFCGACVEVCPTGCLSDKNGSGDREHSLVPCTAGCAAGADVPGYIRSIAGGDYGRAAALIREYLPLPNTLGHICFHDCETVCRRSRLDDPIAICALKRFAIAAGDDRVLEMVMERNSRARSRKVAIVGGGPAGLSAAYFLCFGGYGVTVFEESGRAGGVPATAIPRYRLPAEVMDRDVAFIEKMGVTIETGRRLDSAEEMKELLDDGFDAVVAAVGLPSSKKLDIPGAGAEDVHWGLEYLRRIKAGDSVYLGSDVVVVGGGNVAVDVAMTAMRVAGGRSNVRVFCLESREEMPCHDYELSKAEAEGIEVNTRWGPVAVGVDDGRVESVRFQRCTAVFDQSGRFNPVFDPATTTTVRAASVILAIGQAPAGEVPAATGGVFLAGDAAGPGKLSVVDAVASGRRAAEGVDEFLGGSGDLSVRLADRQEPPQTIGRVEGFASMRRATIPQADPLTRRLDFREIEDTYAEASARYEASRCLQCDLRMGMSSVQLPPERWLEFERSAADLVPAAAGVIVLAGADKKSTLIKGTEDMQAALVEQLESGATAKWFMWEEDGMYTKRESELIQRHLSRYGEMPGGGDDELDDLF